VKSRLKKILTTTTELQSLKNGKFNHGFHGLRTDLISHKEAQKHKEN
jgi:hypothetical protein